MPHYAVYGCGCVYEVDESGNIGLKQCYRHNGWLRVSHETQEWAKRTPEYNRNKGKSDRHYPWD